MWLLLKKEKTMHFHLEQGGLSNSGEVGALERFPDLVTGEWMEPMGGEFYDITLDLFR
jgi:hypothetical protein